MSDCHGVAIFGMGRAGMIHFGNLIKTHRAQLLYIVEQDKPKAEALVAKYRLKETKVLGPDEAQEVYDDKTVNAVVVCTPTFTHEKVVRAALKNGKAVFCEKPISEDAVGTAACYDDADKFKLPLVCSFNRRYDPSVRALYNRVKAGEVGILHTIKSCARDHPLPPMEYLKISGGIFHDCAVHDIDMVCWVLGEWPETVFSLAHAYVPEIREMDDVDTVVINLKFPSGALASIDISRNSTYGYDQRLEVLGAKGMLVSENQRITELHSFNDKGSATDPLKYSFPQRYADSYVLALEHFFNVMEGTETQEISKANTMNVNAIASACEESHKTGKAIKMEF